MPPYSISRATSIDSDCCRLPTTSVLSNKLDKLRFNQFWSTNPSFSRPHIVPKEGIWNIEVHGCGSLGLVEPAREPASSRPKPWAPGAVDATRLGAWLRSVEGLEWLAAGTKYQTLSLSSAILPSFSGMCNLLLFPSFLRKVWTHLNLLSIHLKWKSV